MSRSKTLTVEVSARERTGTSASRQLRSSGSVPGVIYGHGSAGTSITVGQNALLEVLRHTGLIELTSASGDPRSAILKEVQRHPITGHVLHVDFQEVKADEIVQATVPIEAVGEPAGARHGGLLEQVVHELDIECVPADLPESIEVDVSGMDLDDTIHVSDLPIPEGVKSTTDPELPVFQVRLPKEELPEEEEGVEGALLEGEEAAEGAEGAEGEEASEEEGAE
jgi:large subunit ribosomal protein L25